MVELNKKLLDKFLDKFKKQKKEGDPEVDIKDSDTEKTQSKEENQDSSKQEDVSKEKVNSDDSKEDNSKENTEKQDSNNESSTEKSGEKAKSSRERQVVAAIVEKLSSLGQGFEDRFKAIEEKIEALEAKTFEDEFKQVHEKIEKLEASLSDFSSVYETISAQYNPFLKGASTPHLGSDGKKENSEDNNHNPSKENKDDTKSNQHADRPKLNEDQEKESSTKNHKNSDEDDKSKEDVKESGEESSKDSFEDSKNTDFNKKEDHKKEKEVKSGLIDKLIDEEKVKLYNMSKTVEGEKRFMLENGEAISNLLELVEHLNKYPETFKKHVGFNKDNFANWIENSLELPYLADKLKEVKDREEYLFLILSEV